MAHGVDVGSLGIEEAKELLTELATNLTAEDICDALKGGLTDQELSELFGLIEREIGAA